MLGYFEDYERIYLVMECLKGGSLFSLLQNISTQLD